MSKGKGNEHLSMVMWTIYEKPRDYPDGFLARAFEITSGKVVPTMSCVTGETLEQCRDAVRAADSNVTFPIGRSERDDSCVVETWL